MTHPPTPHDELIITDNTFHLSLHNKVSNLLSKFYKRGNPKHNGRVYSDDVEQIISTVLKAVMDGIPKEKRGSVDATLQPFGFGQVVGYNDCLLEVKNLIHSLLGPGEQEGKV